MSKHILTMISLVHQSFMIFVSTLVLILLTNQQYTLYHAIDYAVVIFLIIILSPLFFLFVFSRAPLLVCLPINIITIIIISGACTCAHTAPTQIFDRVVLVLVLVCART